MPKKAPHRDTMPYRDNVGVVVFNTAGDVFLARRADAGPERSGDYAWQFPQGGVDADEPLYEAALRELFEETSIRSVRLLAEAPDWIYYDLPDDLLGISLKGKYRGQRQKWFALLFEGNDDEINVEAPGNGDHAEFSGWRWEPDLTAVIAGIIPFKQDAYRQLVAAFADLPARIRQGMPKGDRE